MDRRAGRGAKHDRSTCDRIARAAELVGLGRCAEAVAIYDALLREDPARPELHYNRAVALYKSGEHGLAEQAFLRAGILRPHWSAPPLAPGQLYSDFHRSGASP